MNDQGDKNRIYLRALEPEDYKITYTWRQDSTYQKGVESMKRYVSMNTEKRWIDDVIVKHEKGQEVRLGIVLKESDELIGMVFLKNINYINKSAKSGSIIGVDDKRGKGIIGEARYELFKYAFYELGLERIYTHIVEYNVRSIKSGEKFGYVKEGVLRNAVYKEGKFHNVIVYSMLREEFIKKYNMP